MRKISFLLAFIFSLSISANTLAISNYENVNFDTGMVTASVLNVRSGPGLSYKVIGSAYKNEYIHIFAKIGDWYVVQTDSNLVGTVNKNYIKAIYPSTNTTVNSKTNTTQTTNKTDVSTSASDLEKQLLSLINEQRKAYGLSELSFDPALQKTAKAKAEDLVANNYFSHTSAIYGSPFDMMKSFGVTYKTAGENIAGNSILEGAVKAWMNSEGHRANILNNAYNLTGIGIVKSDVYGYVMVQMFVGR